MRNSFGMTVYEDKNVIEFKSPYLANKAFDILQKLHVLEAAQQGAQRTAGTACKKHDIDFCAECFPATSRR